MNKLACLVLMVAVVLLAACSSDSSTPTPGPSIVEIDSDTVVVDDATAASATVEETRLVFSRAGNDRVLAWKPGNVVVSGHKAGFLRRVLSVAEEGSNIVVTTEQASLTDAVIRGGVSTQLGEASGTSGHGTKSQPISAGVVFDEDRSGHKLVDLPTFQLELSKGYMAFAPSVNLDFQIKESKLEKFSAIATGQATVRTALKLTCGGTFTKEGEVLLMKSQPMYFTQFIGTVPVVEEVQLSLYLTYKAEASAEVSVEAGSELVGTVSIGAKYENGQWTPVDERTSTFTAIGPELGQKLGVTLEASLKAQMDIQFYAVAGPFLNLEPNASFNLTVLPKPASWELKGGIKSHYGGKLEVLGKELADFDEELFNWETVIASHVYEEDGGVEDATVPEDGAVAESGSEEDAEVDAGGNAGDGSVDGPTWDSAEDATSTEDVSQSGDAQQLEAGSDAPMVNWSQYHKIVDVKFDEGQGTHALDSSGRGNHASLSDSTWVAGRCLTAVQVGDAPQGHISILDAPDIDGVDTFTWSFWFLIPTQDWSMFSGQHGLFKEQQFDESSHTAGGTWITFASDTLAFSSRNESYVHLPGDFHDCSPCGFSGGYSAPKPFADSAWHHAVVRRDGGVPLWTLDGVSGTTNGEYKPPTAMDTGSPLVFGRRPSMPNYTAKRITFDEFRIYKEYLSDAAVQALYETPCAVP